MDKLTAARTLGVEYDSSIEDVRAAFRAKTGAGPTLSGGGTGLSLSGDVGTVLQTDEDQAADGMDDPSDEMDDPDLEYAEGEESLFADIVEEETAKDREEYERQKARETFISLLQFPKSSYDYVQLLEIARMCDLRGDECRGIVKQLTTVRNLIRRGDGRVRRTEGFDGFVGYLYSRMGKTYHPMLIRLKYLVAILIAAFFAIPAVAGVVMGFVEAFTGEMDNMEGMTEKVSFVVMMVLSVLFVVGLIIILRKTREMRHTRRTLIIIAYIVAYFVLEMVVAIIDDSMLM